MEGRGGGMPKQGSVELFVGREWKDKQGRGLGDELGRGESEIGDGGVLPWVSGEMALRGRRVASASSQQGWRNSGGEGSSTRGWPRRAGGGRGGDPERRAGAVRHWRWETEEQAGGRRKGLVCKFRKFQGPICKSKITFNIVLRWKSAQRESCSTFQDLQL